MERQLKQKETELSKANKDALETEKEVENDVKRSLHSRMQPKPKKKAEVAKQSKTTATAVQGVARPFKPIADNCLVNIPSRSVDGRLTRYGR